MKWWDWIHFLKRRASFQMRTEGGFFELLASAVLLNRIWVFLPTKKQSQITDTGLWWRGIQNLLWGPGRSRWSSCSKDLDFFMVSRGQFLKATFGVKVTGFLTFFWLVGGEVTGLCRGSGWRGRWEGGSGWGTHVNPWLFHFNVWQNPLQIKIKKKSQLSAFWFQSFYLLLWARIP